jgi:hypothetical protein
LLCGAGALLALQAAPALAVDREKGVKGPHVGGVPDFVDIQPIILPVIERNAVTRQVGIVVTLELAQGEHADAVEPKRRQLTDAFIRELHTLYAWRSGDAAWPTSSSSSAACCSLPMPCSVKASCMPSW